MTLIGVHLISWCMFRFQQVQLSQNRPCLPRGGKSLGQLQMIKQLLNLCPILSLSLAILVVGCFPTFLSVCCDHLWWLKNGCCVKTDGSALHEAARLLKTLAVHVIQLNNQMRPSFYSPPLFKEAKFLLSAHIE